MLRRSKIREYFDKYTYSIRLHGCRSLYDCYQDPSGRKISIWEQFRHEDYVSVIAYNCHFFTIGYLVKNDEGLFFKVETPYDRGTLLLGPNEKIELNGALYTDCF